MIKRNIFFLTNKFDTIDHGPAKFARILVKSPIIHQKVNFKIITPDVYEKNEYVLKLDQFFSKFLPFRMLSIGLDYVYKIRKIKRKNKIDTIVYNNMIYSIFLTRVFPKIKHIGFINDDNGIDAYQKRKELNYRSLRYLAFYYLERLAMKRLDIIVVNSNYLSEKVSKFYGFKNKIRVLYKGVDMKKINPISNFRKDFKEYIKILFVKSDYTRGGLYVLIEALSRLDSYSFKLTIVGPSSLDMETIKNKSGKHVKINYLGKKDQKEVYRLMQVNDIFSVPSLLEGLGVANIEALAFGINVISTRTGGIPEVCDNGRVARLVTPDNPQELADSILDCINNPLVNKKMNKEGRKFVLEKFNSKNLANNFLKLL